MYATIMLQNQSKTVINYLKHVKNFSICSSRYLGTSTSNVQPRYATGTVINFICAAQNIKTILKAFPGGNNCNFVRNLHISSNLRAPNQKRNQKSEEVRNYIFAATVVLGCITIFVLHQLTNEDFDVVYVEESNT